MLIETALAYARKIGSAETLEQAQECGWVIVSQLEEVKAKIERRKALTLTSEQESGEIRP